MTRAINQLTCSFALFASRVIVPTATFLPWRSAAFSAVSMTTQTKMEEVVRSYFRGVDEKNPELIQSCFGDTATIRDVCGLNDDVRSVPSKVLVERCMDFVTAHPDVKIDFHYGPVCGRDSSWVVAHWFEVSNGPDLTRIR